MLVCFNISPYCVMLFAECIRDQTRQAYEVRFVSIFVLYIRKWEICDEKLEMVV